MLIQHKNVLAKVNIKQTKSNEAKYDDYVHNTVFQFKKL